MDILTRLREAVRSRKGPRYQPVGFEGVNAAWKNRGSPRVRYAVLGVGTIVVLGFVLLIGRHVVPSGSTYKADVVTTRHAPPGYLHLFLAAPRSDLDLCKALVSAAVVGYPTATLVGWVETLEDPHADVEVSLTEEINQIQQRLEGKADDDVVMIVDGYTTWFQLRPQTLLDRFFEINSRADERLRSQLGNQAVSQYNLTQKVVFSAQKTCSLWTPNDPACYAVPQSTLSKDVYGSKTDKATDEDHTRVRPRFLNSGVVVGTAKALHELFKEASHRMEQDSTLRSPQRALSQIFGEQQVYREIVRRKQPKTWSQSVRGMLSTDPRQNLFKQEHIDLVNSRRVVPEFGIGLDYESAIGFASDWATNDVAWLTAQDFSEMDKSNVQIVQPDIISTPPPFWTHAETGLDRNVPWDKVPILTNIRTGKSPVVIQHTGEKSLRETWWDKTWFHKSARTLYTNHIHTPTGPLAVAGNGTSRAWWGSEDYKGGARNGSYAWFRYDDICAETENEVLRDGKGRWVLPDDH